MNFEGWKKIYVDGEHVASVKRGDFIMLHQWARQQFPGAHVKVVQTEPLPMAVRLAKRVLSDWDGIP